MSTAGQQGVTEGIEGCSLSILPSKRFPLTTPNSRTFSVVVQRSPTPLLLFEARVEPRPTTVFGTLNLARRCRREIAADSDTNVRGKVNQRAVSNTVESLSYKDLSNSP